MITEFAREQLSLKGVKVAVPGELERVVVCLADEPAQERVEEVQTANVGERCEVRGHFDFLPVLIKYVCGYVASKSESIRNEDSIDIKLNRLLWCGEMFVQHHNESKSG